MARPAKGYVFEEGGRFKVRLTCPDGTRPTIKLPKGYTREEADAKAAELAEAVMRSGGVTALQGVAPSGETVSGWWGRYLDHREARGQTSVGDAKGRFTKWIEPVIGHLTMMDVTRADIEEIVRRLDVEIAKRVSDREHKAGLSWKTAANVWGEVTSAFEAATRSKDKSLRVRESNPTRDVAPPERGEDREGPVLLASEAAKLLGCRDVPLERRRVYALALYLGARSNELAAITAADVDFEARTVSVHKQRDRKTDEDRATKTRRARTFEIEAALMPLLELLVRERPEGRLLRMPPDEDRAELLRDVDAKRAGLTRPALFADDAMRSPLVFHSLRHSCLTWMGARGDDPMRIQWRGGHTDFTTTQGYMNAGRNLAAAIGKPFPALPAAVLEPSPVVAALEVPAVEVGENAEGPSVSTDEPSNVLPRVLPRKRERRLFFQRPQRDLNPCYRRERPMS